MRKIALFLSCVGFEDYFDQIGLTRETYVHGYHDWSFEYVKLWRALGFETTIYHFARQLAGPETHHRDSPPCTIKFLPMPTLTALLPLIRGHHLLESYLSSLSLSLLMDLRKVDLIWVQEYEWGRFDILVLYAKILGIPIIGQHHGANGMDGGRGIVLHSRAICNASKILCLNQGEYSRAIRRYPCLQDGRLEILYNPLDDRLFYPTDKLSAKKQLGLQAGTRYILFVGRLHPHKGIPYLLEAYAHIRPQYPETVLLLIGTGPLESELKQLVANKGWKGVRFKGWLASKDTLRLYYSASEFLVMSSLREGFPGVAVEAMACGKPILGTQVQGLLEQVTEGVNGFLVPPGDSSALATKMALLLEHPEDCMQMGNNALNIFRDRFSGSAIAAQMKRILEETTGSAEDSIDKESNRHYEENRNWEMFQETSYYQAHFEHAAGAEVLIQKHKQILEWLALQPGARVMDVGCGLGDLAGAISTCGAEVIGVDVSPLAIEEAQKHHPAVQFSLLDGTRLERQFGAGRFDALTCVQVLEHIPPEDVDSFIEQLAACLREGGQLLLDVPVTDNLSDRWLMFRNQHLRGMHRPPGAIDSSFNPTHLWKIGNLEHLIERFRARGLEPERVQKLYYVPWILDRLQWGHLICRLPARWQEQFLKGGTVLFRKGAAYSKTQTMRFSAFWSDPAGTRGLGKLRKLLA